MAGVRRGGQRARRRGAHERVGIGDRRRRWPACRPRRGVAAAAGQRAGPRDRRAASGPRSARRAGSRRRRRRSGRRAAPCHSAAVVCRPLGNHSATVLRGPVRRPGRCGTGAGVRRSDGHRQVGPRHAEAVIAPLVDDHVGLRRHVAVDALRAGAARLVMGDAPRTSNFAGMWHCAQSALPSARSCRAVRLVAVRAGDAGMVHPALQERAVFEHLAVDLAVGMVQARLQQRRQVGVEEWRADRRVLGDRPCGARGTARRRRAPAEPSGSVRCAMPVSAFISQTPCRVGLSQP